jgi:hypothetical protein
VLVGCKSDGSGNADDAESSGGSDETGDGDGDGDGDGETSCPEPENADPVDGLEHLGRAQYGSSGGFIEILDVVAEQTIVFACTGTQGVMIWDAQYDAPVLAVEDLGGPYANPQFPRCQHIGADFSTGRMVITSRGDEVQPTPFVYMFDVSNPAQPLGLRGWQGQQSVEGAAIVGDRVFTAVHDDGILVFDDPGSGSDLVASGSFTDADSDAWQVVADGDTLVVAEGSTGLRTYDISGASPELVATLPLGGSSKDVVLQGDLAYVASSSQIAIVDVGDPEAPTLLGERAVAGTALAVAMGRNQTLLVAEWGQLRGYDVSDPANIEPVLTQVVPTTSSFSRVLAVDTVRGDQPDEGRVYAGEWEGMHAFRQRDCNYGPEIEITPQTFTFGNVEIGQHEDAVLIVENLGNQPLVIDDIRSSHEEMSVDETSLEIGPGHKSAVEVRFSPTFDTQLSAAITFDSNDIDEESVWANVHGNVNGLGVGDPVPGYSLFDLEGQQHDSADLTGQVTLLAYFATF